MKKEPDDRTRKTAVQAIASIGKRDEEAVKVLIRLLQTDSNPIVQTNAAEALSKIDPYTSSSRQELIKFLPDKNEDLRVSASVGLSNIATSLQEQYQSKKETDGLSQAITDLDNSKKAMESASQLEWQNKEKKEKFVQQQDIINRKLSFLKEQKKQEWWQNFNNIIDHPVAQLCLFVAQWFLLFIVIYLIIFSFFPLVLLKLDERWKWVSEVDP